MKEFVFVYGGLLDEAALEENLKRLPSTKEYQLQNWKRVWNLSLPAGFKIGDDHRYVPKDDSRGICPTFLNIIPDDGSFTLGKLVELKPGEIEKFDEFEGVSIGVMERTEMMRDQEKIIYAYTGGSSFVKCFEENQLSGKTQIPQFYYNCVLKAKACLTGKLDKHDALAQEPDLSIFI
jgi:hypothetical protein